MRITKKTVIKSAEVSFSDITLALLAAMITVLILLASLSYAFSPFDPEKPVNTLTMRHGEFDVSFFDGINADYEDINAGYEVFHNKTSFYYPQFIREILFFHMDIGFLSGLIFGADSVLWLLITLYLIKYGILGALTFLLLRRGFSLGRMPATVLSVAFSVSSLVYTIGLNTALFNAIVILPGVCLLILNFVRNGGIKNLIWSIAGILVFTLSGVYAVAALPILLLIFIVILIGTRNTGFNSYRRLLAAFLSGSLLSLYIIVPFLKSSRFIWNIKPSITEGKVKFTLFDSVYKLLDGNLSGGSLMDRMPAIGVGAFVVMLLVLFFINHVIPFKFKITSGILLLLLYISVSYDAFERILVFEGASYSFSYLRVALMAFLILIMSAISIKNAATLRKGEVYVAVFAVIIYIILSNNSASEIVHGTVSMYLSALVAILSGCIVIAMADKKEGVSYFLMLLILGEIALNAAFVLAPASFNTADVRADSVLGNYNEASDNYIFESGKMEYIVLSEDLSELSSFIPPHERVNTVARSLYINNVFNLVENYPVYVSGAATLGDGMYEALPESSLTTVNLRITRNDLVSDVYLSSSYVGHANIRLLYGETEENISVSSPFLIKLDVNEMSYIAAIDFSGGFYGRFDLSAVVSDKDALAEFKGSINEIRNNEINLSSNHSMIYDGTRTVITSVKYSPDLEIIYTKANKIYVAKSFNLNGLLAFNVESGGFDHQQAKIISSRNDLIVGFVSTVIVFISLIILCIMYNNKAV